MQWVTMRGSKSLFRNKIPNTSCDTIEAMLQFETRLSRQPSLIEMNIRFTRYHMEGHLMELRKKQNPHLWITQHSSTEGDCTSQKMWNVACHVLLSIASWRRSCEPCL